MSEEANQRSTRYERLSGLRPEALMSQGIPQPASDDDETLEIAGFEIQELIGRGGMGFVYLARQIGLDRKVAIKRVTDDLQGEPLLLERLEREAQTMAKLQHPNIVTVHQLEKLENGGAAIVMEYVVGGNLRDLINANANGMPLDEALRLVREIGSALSAAHASGLIHRDVKPENVLIDQAGVARVTDFGLAVPLGDQSTRLTLTGTTVGTIDYLAPERFDPNNTADTSCDIYALGVMLYEMLTGTLPRGNFAPPRQIRPSIPRALSEATMKSLRPDPSERFTSVDGFISALDKKIHLPRRRSLLVIGLLSVVLGLLAWASRTPSLPTTPTTTEDPPQEPPAEEEWRDLLSNIDLKANTISGSWNPVEGGVINPRMNSILSLSQEMREPYEVRTTFVRVSGTYSMGLFITANESVGSVSLASRSNRSINELNGLQSIGGETLKERQGFKFRIINGEPYELLVQVRRGRVKVFIDGHLYEESIIGDKKLGIIDTWDWDIEESPSALAIGSWVSPTLFKSVEWRPLPPESSEK